MQKQTTGQKSGAAGAGAGAGGVGVVSAGAMGAGAVGAGAVGAGTVTAGNKSKAPKAKIPLPLIATLLTVVFLIGGIIIGIELSGMHLHDSDGPPLITTSFIDGTIEFYGGVDHRGTNRVNPAFAEPAIGSEYGEITILGWWIRPIDSEDILFEGDCANPGDAFTELLSSGEFGEYKLYFRLTERTGAVHIIGGNFFIEEF